MIPNKFLCYLTEEAFNVDLKNGEIKPKSIALVLDKGFIYSHGTYFYCGFSPEVEKTITASITELHNAIEGSNKVIAQALCEIKSSMLNKKDFKLDEINADLENKRQEIINDVTEIKGQINSEMTTLRGDVNATKTELTESMTDLEEQVENSISDLTEQVDTKIAELNDPIIDDEKVTAHSLSDFNKKLSDTNLIVSYIINQFRSELLDIKNKLTQDEEL